jgi:hypothetical protein
MMDIAKELSASIVALASLAAGLSTFVKTSWVVLVLWSVAQVVWYRRVRVVEAGPIATVRKTARRRTVRKRQAASAEATAPEVVPDLSLAATAGETVYR